MPTSRSPCQFFNNGDEKNWLVAATAFARATPFVLAGALVVAVATVTLVAGATITLVAAAITVRLEISARGMIISRANELLRETRLFVSERSRPVIRSPFFNSSEMVCEKA